MGCKNLKTHRFYFVKYYIKISYFFNIINLRYCTGTTMRMYLYGYI